MNTRVYSPIEEIWHVFAGLPATIHAQCSSFGQAYLMSLYCSKVYKTNVSYFWRAGMQLVSTLVRKKEGLGTRVHQQTFQRSTEGKDSMQPLLPEFHVQPHQSQPLSYPLKVEATLHEDHLYWQAFNSMYMYVTRCCVQCQCLPVDSCTPVLVEHPSPFSQPRLRPPSGNTSCLDQYFLMYQSLDCNKKGGRLKRERRIIPRL